RGERARPAAYQCGGNPESERRNPRPQPRIVHRDRPATYVFKAAHSKTEQSQLTTENCQLRTGFLKDHASVHVSNWHLRIGFVRDQLVFCDQFSVSVDRWVHIAARWQAVPYHD